MILSRSTLIALKFSCKVIGPIPLTMFWQIYASVDHVHITFQLFRTYEHIPTHFHCQSRTQDFRSASHWSTCKASMEITVQILVKDFCVNFIVMECTSRS